MGVAWVGYAYVAFLLPPCNPKNVFLFILVFILVVATHWSIYIPMRSYYNTTVPRLILLLSIVTTVFFCHFSVCPLQSNVGPVARCRIGMVNR